jgi:hypothetical protein
VQISLIWINYDIGGKTGKVKSNLKREKEML